MTSLQILICECLPRGCAVFSLVLTCFSRKVNKHTWKLWKANRTERKIKEERFLLCSRPKIGVTKAPRPPVLPASRKTGGKLEENWMKSRGKLEENRMF